MEKRAVVAGRDHPECQVRGENPGPGDRIEAENMSKLANISLRTRLIIGLLLVVILSGLTSTIVGIRIINDRVIQQAQNKVRLDLNTAHEIYDSHFGEIRTILEYSVIRPSIWNSLATGDTLLLEKSMMGLYERSGLDILNITNDELEVVVRCRNNRIFGDYQGNNAVLAESWEKGKTVISTEILPREELLKEGEDLAERAFMHILPTPKARPSDQRESTDGMCMIVSVPVFDDNGDKIGLIYGGDLLNRKYDIVDKIKDIVYRNEQYEGKDIGTSTMFQGELRISTNVVTMDGSRAIGTRVSSEVAEQVLASREKWIGRAFVVNDWYITAYEPIYDISGNPIGILYVGILEKPYNDLMLRTMLIFLTITGAGMALALITSYILSRSILKPIGNLVKGAQRLAGGEFDTRIPVESRDELGTLCSAFNEMGEALADRERQLKERMQEQLTQSEKLASIGRLAAGVAHEINTPLTGILTYSSLLMEERSLPESVRRDLKVIVDETTRCRQIVRNLLDFARETKIEVARADINRLIHKTLDIVRKQSLFRDIDIREKLQEELPEVMVDPNQIRQVIMNLVLNAAEAMPDGGYLFITTEHKPDRNYIRLSLRDTGCGIPPEDLERIFQPFFTTKERGKGTGLGLSVSYGIVQRHGGTITVASQVGKGTTFEIQLPIAEKDGER